MNKMLKGCIRLVWIIALLVLELVQQIAGAPTCREGYYWLSVANECVSCSKICFPGSTYIQSCWNLCGQTIPPTTTPTPPKVTNQTTPALASTTPPIAGVVEQVLDSYAIYIIPSVVVFAGIIVALIFRHKVKALVTRIFRCLFPIHAALPTQEQYSGAEVAQTDLAHRPNGVALENANGIPVPCNNGAVQQNGSVLQSRVAVQNGFRYQNGLVQHEGVQNGYHHQNGIIQQGFVNPQQNGAVHQCLVIFQPNGIIHQNEVANQYEIRAMPSHDASVMNTENTERQRLLTEELPLTNQLQARQTPSDTASNTNDVSQSPLDAEFNDHTTDSESNNDSPIGSTSRPERNVI